MCLSVFCCGHSGSLPYSHPRGNFSLCSPCESLTGWSRFSKGSGLQCKEGSTADRQIPLHKFVCGIIAAGGGSLKVTIAFLHIRLLRSRPVNTEHVAGEPRGGNTRPDVGVAAERERVRNVCVCVCVQYANMCECLVWQRPLKPAGG